MDVKIYEIPAAIAAALDALRVDEGTGEIIGTESLDALRIDAREKALGAARWIGGQRAMIDAMRVAEFNIRTRRQALERRCDWLSARTIEAMQSLGVQKLEAPDICARVRKSPQSVEVYDSDQLPDRFWRVKVEPDKVALRAALKAGEDIQGARLSDESYSLSIK